MKVVLFCGGLGMRLRDYSDTIPKPMVNVGTRPILWNLMKYYAHFGHKEFILCLGYKGDMIKRFFLEYDACISNDFILANDGTKLITNSTDIHDWKIHFIDTGYCSNIGERLKLVSDHLKGESMFLANYSDGLTDLNLNNYLTYFQESDKIGCFLSTRPTHTFHVTSSDDNGYVQTFSDITKSGFWINAGFFVFKTGVLEYIHEGEELVQNPFQRLMKERELITYRYDGFWAPMDTFKDKQVFDDMYRSGESPWEVWKESKTFGYSIAAAPTGIDESDSMAKQNKIVSNT